MKSTPLSSLRLNVQHSTPRAPATSRPLASLDSRSRCSRHAFNRYFASLSLQKLSNGYLHVCPT
ncbi:hypothetical protein BDN71DRAFT_1456077 [Pleurotus eryngii]|uniref:Uncharacterized protein n=1 Tax=Pleurotus eryngii TaxID=5323 RepID=A0A9P5ZLH3_PLEER|nr:hypothetical protein BDN71DRAFT_1456077 [Pleurotus eryngii]